MKLFKHKWDCSKVYDYRDICNLKLTHLYTLYKLLQKMIPFQHGKLCWAAKGLHKIFQTKFLLQLNHQSLNCEQLPSVIKTYHSIRKASIVTVIRCGICQDILADSVYPPDKFQDISWSRVCWGNRMWKWWGRMNMGGEAISSNEGSLLEQKAPFMQGRDYHRCQIGLWAGVWRAAVEPVGFLFANLKNVQTQNNKTCTKKWPNSCHRTNKLVPITVLLMEGFSSPSGRKSYFTVQWSTTFTVNANINLTLP